MHSARTVACQQGLEAMRSSEFAKAAELFERAASEGEGPAAFHYLGVARLKQGELHAAVAAYRKALDGSPESWHAQYALAME